MRSTGSPGCCPGSSGSRRPDATHGLGGPAAAPGAPTDAEWAAECDVLLSGSSGDVIWGDTARGGPPNLRRARRLGLQAALRPLRVPSAPAWVSPGGRRAWFDLHTRQARVTWLGSASRRALTPVVPVAWHAPLVAFCLALPDADRRDRALLRAVLARHAPDLHAIPTVKSAFVHDLDRAWRRSPRLQAELRGRLLRPAGWGPTGLDRQELRRRLERCLAGARNEARTLGRAFAVHRWGLVAEGLAPPPLRAGRAGDGSPRGSARALG